jgi:hypothetical protein
VAALLAGCARSVDMSVASLYEKPAEFDFMVSGAPCDGTPGRQVDVSACPPGGGRQLRELLAQRSSSRSLKTYLVENGAACEPTGTDVTCHYTRKIGEASFAWSRLGSSSPQRRVEIVIKFPASDQGLRPDQIQTALK